MIMAVPILVYIWNMALFMTENLVKLPKILKINFVTGLSYSNLKPSLLHQSSEQSSNTRLPLCFSAVLTQ